MKAFQHKSNLKHTAVLLFGIMMSCATVKAQDVPCLPSSFGETESQSAWCGIVAYTLHITAYGESTSEGGWYLIASPIGSVVATDVVNLVASTTPEDPTNFDLYRFNEAADLEWENWKSHANNNANYHFDLVVGRGYLYANATDVTLVFAGTPYSGNGEVTLHKTDGVPLSGWNLVGNPFNETAYINREFYIMNGEGSEIIAAEDNSIAPMEGVFVVATTDGETMTFTTEAPANDGDAKLSLNLSSGHAVIDRAIVRFSEGRQLPKFQLNRNSTKLYLPQGGKDYAIANAEDQTGEIPVSFKAEKDGSYTLSLSSENMSFSYLHLIDNLTGEDIDMLPTQNVIADSDPQSPTPMYTFTAKRTDYESRFKLVFVCGDANDDNETFAFINNGNIIVNGEGMLQIVDVMGRIIVSRDGVHTVSTTGMTPGVYVLRLINGDDVKTQKIVVE